MDHHGSDEVSSEYEGSRDFLSSECVVRTALSVERTYLGEQLASGDGVTLV